MPVLERLRRFRRAAAWLVIAILALGLCAFDARAQLVSGQDRAPLLAEQDQLFQRMLREPGNLEARSAMQLGAHFAGIAIENSMLGACHACANPLTAHYGMTHGIAIGILLPHVLRFNAPAAGHLYAELAHGAGLLNGDLGSAAESLARRISDLVQIAGLPANLSSYGVSEGILHLLAEEAADQWTGHFNPRPVGQAELLQLYTAAL